MKIGIDIDDTITNTYQTLLTIIAMKYGVNYKELINENLSYDEVSNKFDNFNKNIKDLFYIMAKSVTLKENVKEIITMLKNEGHKIILITARNYDEYDNPYEITLDYLNKKDIPFDELHINILEKGVFCKENNIDLFIDDNVNHCNKVKEQGVKTIQFDTDFSDKVKDVLHVTNWNQIYEIINN